MTSSSILLREYRSLRPDIQKLYVIPHIGRFAENNPYLQLLYKDLLTGREPDAIKLESFSFLSPKVIWRRLRGERSLLHHHWFEFYNGRSLLNLIWKLLATRLYRMAGGKVVWTVHNRQPHSGKFAAANRLLRRLWARIPHKIHVHCQSCIAEVAAEFHLPVDRFFVVQHPPYPVRPLPAAEARRQLARRHPRLEQFLGKQPLFLMFGYIAEYKGVVEVADIFSGPDGRGILLIAGAVKRGAKRYFENLRNAARQNPRIEIRAERIPDGEVAAYFCAADYILFNYHDILTSGGIMLALSYGRRIIAPDIGCVRELSGENILKFDSPEGLAGLLGRLCA